MKISKKSEYGLRAMVRLAKLDKNTKGIKSIASDKKYASIREIANLEHMPFEFLAKIFEKLERAKLVKASRGANGGYCLAKPANKITPADIVAVLEEEVATAHCSGCPMAGGCGSQQVWSEVQQSLDKSLSEKTLADLIR